MNSTESAVRGSRRGEGASGLTRRWRCVRAGSHITKTRRSRSGEILYQSIETGRSSPFKHVLAAQSQRRANTNQKKCPHCGVVRHVKDLSDHIRRVHKPEQAQKCRGCIERFNSTQARKDHETEAHPWMFEEGGGTIPCQQEHGCGL